MTDSSSGTHRMFERKAYSELKEWKERSNGRTAILIRGARRVGKTTLAKEFARNEYGTYVLIDFSEENKKINALFNDLDDLNRFFRGLQLHTGVEFKERDTAIIFDDVQYFPRAREAIKKLVADGRYDYIETGSMISVSKNVKNILIPSEEEKMMLHPMDFEEFLWANGDRTYRLLERTLDSRQPLPDALHRTMMTRYSEYLAVGGMPQAVGLFVDGKSYREIDKMKRNIVDLYVDDFRKLDSRGRLGEYFVSIPPELSRQSTRYRIKGKSMERELKRIFEMEESGTVRICRHTENPGFGLIGLDIDVFKLFLEDTGLLVTLCFYDGDFSDNRIYGELMNGDLPADLNYVYKNAVAQELTAAGYGLFYHTFPGRDFKHGYETDFVIPRGRKICPIEVKTTRISSHVSLDSFMKKYKSRVGKGVVISARNLKEENGIVYLPLYMVGMIGRL